MSVPLLVVRTRAIQRQIFRQHGNFLRIQIVHLIFLCVVGVRLFYAIGRLKDIAEAAEQDLPLLAEHILSNRTAFAHIGQA